MPAREASPDPSPSDDEIHAFQDATRDLIGVALRSLDAVGGSISLSQLRVLMAVNDLGCVPSARVAAFLGAAPSSITRMADRLVAGGYLVRGDDPHNRSVVTLELGREGRRVVDAVIAWRHDELARLLSALDPAQRSATAAALRELHRVVGESYAEIHGPVPL